MTLAQSSFAFIADQHFMSHQTNGFETPLSTLSALPKDQALPCRFHHIFGHGTQVVNLLNPLDLHQQTVNDAKVASCNAHNRGESPPSR
jgi:hypothetical protein